MKDYDQKEAVALYEFSFGPMKLKGGEYHAACPGLCQGGTDRFWLSRTGFGCRGCSPGRSNPEAFQAIARALGMSQEPSDQTSTYAFKPGDPDAPPAEPEPGCTLAQYAEKTQLPIEWLKSTAVLMPGLSDTRAYHPRLEREVPAVAIPYGNGLVQLRIGVTGPDKFCYQKGSKAALYGVGWLATAQVLRNRRVVLVEGASCSQTCWFHGIPAIGVPGASMVRKLVNPALFEEVDELYVIQEHDEEGRKFPIAVAEALVGTATKVIPLKLKAPDVNELHRADPENFKREFQDSVKAARKAAGLLEWKWACESANSPLVPIDWICYPLIKPGLAIMWAPALAGKSTVALQVCAAVATGTAALGMLAAEKGAVRYVWWESGTVEDQRRMWAHIGKPPGTFDDADFMILSDLPKANDGGLKALGKMLSENPQIRLLVIDTMARFRGDGDKEGGANAFYSESQNMADIESLITGRPRLCVLLVHHSTASGVKISGTEAVRSVPQTIIKLDRPDPDAFEGTLSVSHNGAAGAKFALRLVPGQGWQVADGDFRAAYRAKGYADSMARGAPN